MHEAFAQITNGTDARTVVRRLPDGCVEIRHMQFAEGLGWYGTQRIVLQPDAATALGVALNEAQSETEAQLEAQTAARPPALPATDQHGTNVISLAAWRAR